MPNEQEKGGQPVELLNLATSVSGGKKFRIRNSTQVDNKFANDDGSRERSAAQ